MTRNIYILHKSEIVRQGLSSVIKDLFKVESLLLADIVELDDYVSDGFSEIILLVDGSINKNLITNVKSKFLKIIHILDSGQPTRCKKNCNCCLPLEASKEHIFALIKPHLNSHLSTRSNKDTLILTARETEVLKRVATGKTNKEIADDLSISFHTVISHRKNITEKLGIKSIPGLTVYAILSNLIDASTIDPETLI